MHVLQHNKYSLQNVVLCTYVSVMPGERVRQGVGIFVKCHSPKPNLDTYQIGKFSLCIWQFEILAAFGRAET